MSDSGPSEPDPVSDPNAGVSGERCPVCGAELLVGTLDLADTPAESAEDVGRTELRPGQMAQSVTCPTPECPGPDAGAQL